MASVILLVLLQIIVSIIKALIGLGGALDNVNSLGNIVNGTIADPVGGITNVLSTVTNVVSTACDDLPYINVQRSDLFGTWYYQLGTNSSITSLRCATWTLTNVNNNVGKSEIFGYTSTGSDTIDFFQAGICGGKYQTFKTQDLVTGDATLIILYFNKTEGHLIFYICRYSPSNTPTTLLFALTREQDSSKEDIDFLYQKAIDTNLSSLDLVTFQQMGCPK